MTYTKAIRILEDALSDAGKHRDMALSVGDRDKANKFRDILNGFRSSINTLENHRTAKPRRTGYDSTLADWAR